MKKFAKGKQKSQDENKFSIKSNATMTTADSVNAKEHSKMQPFNSLYYIITRH